MIYQLDTFMIKYIKTDIIVTFFSTKPTGSITKLAEMGYSSNIQSSVLLLKIALLWSICVDLESLNQNPSKQPLFMIL